jgi:hypothetical protein
MTKASYLCFRRIATQAIEGSGSSFERWGREGGPQSIGPKTKRRDHCDGGLQNVEFTVWMKGCGSKETKVLG